MGRVALNEVVRGVFGNAYLGYFVDEAVNGRGYATEAVRRTVRFAFDELRLHRVQAAVVPRNAGSVRVLEKAGFREEGYAERYLCINGVWRTTASSRSRAKRFRIGPNQPSSGTHDPLRAPPHRGGHSRRVRHGHPRGQTQELLCGDLSTVWTIWGLAVPESRTRNRRNGAVPCEPRHLRTRLGSDPFD